MTDVSIEAYIHRGKGNGGEKSLTYVSWSKGDRVVYCVVMDPAPSQHHDKIGIMTARHRVGSCRYRDGGGKWGNFTVTRGRPRWISHGHVSGRVRLGVLPSEIRRPPVRPRLPVRQSTNPPTRPSASPPVRQSANPSARPPLRPPVHPSARTPAFVWPSARPPIVRPRPPPVRPCPPVRPSAHPPPVRPVRVIQKLPTSLFWSSIFYLFYAT